MNPVSTPMLHGHVGTRAMRSRCRAPILQGRHPCATVCYMTESGGPPARVGVRELRQNLSIYLDRVKAGETLEVTERGEPVAELRPRPGPRRSIVDQMIADGRITPATHDHRLTPPPPPASPGYTGPTLTEILLQMRDEDDR